MFEAYHVAVRLRLVDHVSHGLTHLSHQFARVHGHAAALQRQIHQIRLTAMAGFAVGAVGIFGLMTLRAPYESARNFNTEIARFNALGLGASARREALQFTSAMTEIGTSLQEKMELYRDAMTVFRGDEHHAEMVMPSLVRMRFAMQVLHGGEHGGNMDRQFMDLLRVMELRGGLVSEERALREMNFAFQTLNTSGGRVNPQALLAFMQTSGQAGRGLSQEALFYGFEPVIQEMGGPRAGTALMTMMNRFMTGRFIGQGGRAAGEEMLRLGLLDRSRVEFNNRGQFVRYRPGGTALIDPELFTTNPFEWYHRHMLPAQRRAGIDTDTEFLTSNLLTGSRTGARLLDIWRVQEQIIRRGITMAEQADTIDESYYAAQDTERGLELGTSRKFHDLMIRLGQAVVPLAVAGMQNLIPMLESMEQWVTRHPVKVRYLITAFAGLSAAMAIGGIVLMLSAAFRGLGLALSMLNIIGPIFGLIRLINPWVLGFTLLAGALTLLYTQWAPFRNVVNSVLDFFGKLFGIADASAADLSVEDLGLPELGSRAGGFAQFLIMLGTAGLALNLFGRAFTFMWSVVGGGLGVLRIALVALAGIIGWPAVAIGALVIAIGALGVWLYNNVEPFRNAVDGIIGALSRMVNWIADKAQAIWERLSPDMRRNAAIVGGAAMLGPLGLPAAIGGLIGAHNDNGSSPFVRNQAANNNTPPGNVYLDGRLVGDVVAERIARSMRSPAVAAGSPDPNRAAATAGIPYTR